MTYIIRDRFDKKQAVIKQALNLTETVFIAGQTGKISSALIGLI